LQETHVPTTVYDMDLATLIQRTKGERSYEQLADSSPDSPSRQRWQQMGSRPTSADLPKPRTVRAMAAALGVSERVVILAVARTAGLDVGENRASLVTLLPPSADRLSDTQVAAVLAVVRAILENHAAPTKPAAMTNAAAEDHDSTGVAKRERRAAQAKARRAKGPKSDLG
jgi:uncharacterized protein YejL (UPF0352 family)